MRDTFNQDAVRPMRTERHSLEETLIRIGIWGRRRRRALLLRLRRVSLILRLRSLLRLLIALRIWRWSIVIIVACLTLRSGTDDHPSGLVHSHPIALGHCHPVVVVHVPTRRRTNQDATALIDIFNEASSGLLLGEPRRVILVLLRLVRLVVWLQMLLLMI